ncbi:MAG TPA: hypothetical protein VLI04_13955 [Nocardioidaceae bacterium]|nr:hypothetical protein [Nocardioidaceae bacterium]
MLAVLLLLSYTDYHKLFLPAACGGLLVIALTSFYGFYTFFAIPRQPGLLGTLIWLVTLIPSVRTPFRTSVFLTFVVGVAGTSVLGGFRS